MEVRTLRWLVRGCLALATVLLLALSCPPARADEQIDARTLFERGVEASRAERWQEARILFERSLNLVVKPSTLINLAISYLKLGRGQDAIEALDKFQQVAHVDEHAAMLERAHILRAQAEKLVENERATATQGGRQALSEERARNEEGLSDAARREVARARDAFARGNDRQALEAFERAYKESPKPELLYNIGVVADRLRDDERAVRAYDAFAAALPDAPETAVAQVRSTALRKALADRKAAEERKAAERAAAAEAEPPAKAAAPPVPAPNLWPARVVLIAGGAVGAGAIGLVGNYVWHLRRIAACKQANRDPGGTRCPTDSLPAVRRERDHIKIAAIAVGGAAVATLTVGTALLIRQKRQHARKYQVALLPQVELGAERTVGLALSGRF